MNGLKTSPADTAATRRPHRHPPWRGSPAGTAATGMLAAGLGAWLSFFPAPPAWAGGPGWADGCLPFIPAAERFYGLPPGLLLAIALTESGRNGSPYPWALNVGGQPVMAPSYQEAAALLRLPDGRPRRDVAVGCMQIHMTYHLESFNDPEWALHPKYNVWYAASFLDGLRRRYGNLSSAVAHYHASDPAAQRLYLCQVARHLAATAPGMVPQVMEDCQRPASPRLPTGRTVAERTAAGRIAAGRGEGDRRVAIMAARRVGRIIVIGRDRSIE
ncbi:MAG: lytic transglycosylase domain-containing protein [Telmatospirillum sp.]|nr:lytic transglycosylase domain-containing protein [Telmatospirillum sp.]